MIEQVIFELDQLFSPEPFSATFDLDPEKTYMTYFSLYMQALTSTWANDGGTYFLGLYDIYLDAEVASVPGPQEVPEPSTLLLIISGLVGLEGFRRKFKRS